MALARLSWLRLSLGGRLLCWELLILVLSRCLFGSFAIGWCLHFFLSGSSCESDGELAEVPLQLVGVSLVLFDLSHGVLFGPLLLSGFLLLPLLVLFLLQLLLSLYLLGGLLLVFFWSWSPLGTALARFACGSWLLDLFVLGLGCVCLWLLIFLSTLALWLLLPSDIPVVGANLLRRSILLVSVRGLHLESQQQDLQILLWRRLCDQLQGELGIRPQRALKAVEDGTGVAVLLREALFEHPGEDVLGEVLELLGVKVRLLVSGLLLGLLSLLLLGKFHLEFGLAVLEVLGCFLSQR